VCWLADFFSLPTNEISSLPTILVGTISTLSKEKLARLGLSKTILSCCSSSIRCCSTCCGVGFSTFLNHNHDKKPHHHNNSSDLSTLAVVSFSSGEFMLVSIDFLLVFLKISTSFLVVLALLMVFFVVDFAGVFGIDSKIT
jgi:hypothetical protein